MSDLALVHGAFTFFYGTLASLQRVRRARHARPRPAKPADRVRCHCAVRVYAWGNLLQNTEGDRYHFLDLMKELGRGIVPFIRHFETQTHPAFDPLAYTALPPVRAALAGACGRRRATAETNAGMRSARVEG